jgi:DMSO/TMAO reductase YedYZ molybdopterin-dependent catalytic subunit
MTKLGINRRRFLSRVVPGAGALALAGCDALSESPQFRDVLGSAQDLTKTVQRALLSSDSLAREFTEADISPDFRANGTTNPSSAEYRALAENGFGDWRLKIGGLVERPAEFSLDDLRAMPARTQITRHDCVEGWSSIGKWTGVQLSHVLDQVGLKPEARYVVSTCADELGRSLDGNNRYYESIDLFDALHPQTILAYEMNDQVLPIAHGAPLRMRVERQLGYKMAKYIMQIDAVDSLTPIGRGNGGYWPARGYDWYAGI